jgi:hypothetical protein
MAIGVECPSCGRRFRANDRHRGKETNCPKCRSRLRIDGDDLPDHDVFISYAHQDRAAAEAVCGALEDGRVRCWIAPRDVLPGTDWGGAITGAIGRSRALVLVYSSHANASQQVLREVERAVGKRVPVVPVRVEDVPPSKNMEYFLSSSHWLDALAGPIEHHLPRVVESVDAVLGSRPAAAASGGTRHVSERCAGCGSPVGPDFDFCERCGLHQRGDDKVATAAAGPVQAIPLTGRPLASAGTPAGSDGPAAVGPPVPVVFRVIAGLVLVVSVILVFKLMSYLTR